MKPISQLCISSCQYFICVLTRFVLVNSICSSFEHSTHWTSWHSWVGTCGWLGPWIDVLLGLGYYVTILYSHSILLPGFSISFTKQPLSPLWYCHYPQMNHLWITWLDCSVALVNKWMNSVLFVKVSEVKWQHQLLLGMRLHYLSFKKNYFCNRV